jgi:type IV secretory pathway component VirB8
MPPQPPKTELPETDRQSLEIAEKVRTGEYFREARGMYDMSVHDPMAERYLYIFITVLALVILAIAQSSMQGLYPLNTQVPLIVDTNDTVEDLPRIQSLVTGKDEAPAESLLRFLVRNYVIMREEYNINTFDRNVNGLKSQSSEAVVKEFQQYIDPRNPDSPITLYQRHSRRHVTVLAIRRVGDGMEVVYDAVVESKTDIKKSRWRADIAFQYSGIELDDKTDKVKPLTFVVTNYHSKRLQDVK